MDNPLDSTHADVMKAQAILEKLHKIHVSNLNTSGKYCKKEWQSFSHCSPLDHLDLQSLNDYNFFLLVL